MLKHGDFTSRLSGGETPDFANYPHPADRTSFSSPHIVGQILDRVYTEGSLTSPPLTTVQTTVVPLAAPRF
jgi:hypothetical protein